MTTERQKALRARSSWRARGDTAIVLICAASLLAACGGGDGDGAAASNAPQNNVGGNTPATAGGSGAPTIAGVPASQVMQGQAFSFTPAAADADGGALTFSIANRPSWASFDTVTGRLSGTPTAGDIGAYRDIVIAVTDGTSTARLASFNLEVVAIGSRSVALTWASPTQNVDGSPLTDLAGFKIYWGASEETFPNSVVLANPGLSDYVVEQLTPGTWYFAMSAVNAAGVESELSTPVWTTL